MTTTYVLLASYTATSTVTSITFSSISSAYTDLKLVFSGRGSSTGTPLYSINTVRMNAVAANYNNKVLDNYNGIASYTDFNGVTSNFILGVSPNGSSTANTFSNGELYFGNYASSSYRKIAFGNSVASHMTSTVNEYDLNLVASRQTSTAAISSIELNGISWVSGSTAYLYGIQRA